MQVVDGEYRAYGQDLVIEEGRIYFAGGPVTRPALDTRAVRRLSEGVLLAGKYLSPGLSTWADLLFSVERGP